MSKYMSDSEPVPMEAEFTPAVGLSTAERVVSCEVDRMEMDYGEACIELAKLIEAGHYDYPESAGLAMQVLQDSVGRGDTPRMALAFAKNLDVKSEAGISN